jgi:hypothetical protein
MFSSYVSRFLFHNYSRFEVGVAVRRLRQYPHITATNGTAPRSKAEFRTTGLWTDGRTKKKEWRKEKASAFAEPTARQVGQRAESDQDLVGSLVQLLRFYVKLLQEIGEAAHGEDAG